MDVLIENNSGFDQVVTSSLDVQIENNSRFNQTVTSSLDYETKGDARLVTVLYKKIEEMERKVRELETKKIIDETQFPISILEANGLLPLRPDRLKRGRGYRQLLQSEIEESMKHSLSARGRARWLGIAVVTYTKYAKMYGIYDPLPNRKGRKNLRLDPNRGKYPLTKILTGDLNGCSSVTNESVRKKLIKSGTFPPMCNICGYDKVRIDGKIGLLIDHRDGNLKNFKRENLQLLCLNCMFECGRGYIRKGNHMFNTDIVNDINS